MTQEQFLKAENIMVKRREYYNVLSRSSITISYSEDAKPLTINTHADEYEDFKKFIISQIMKLDKELEEI